MIPRFLPGLALLPIVLCACGDMRRPTRLRFTDRSLATAEKVASEIDMRLSSFESRQGDFRVGDTESRFTAWFDAGELRRIEEMLSVGEFGSSTIHYYFNNRALFLYREQANRSGAGKVGTAGERIERAFAYDSVGQLVESRKLVNGQPAPVEDYELMAVRNHTAELKRALQK